MHVYEEGHVRDLYILHVPTFHHTYTHMLGTHASFLGFTMLRWSLSGETLDRGGPEIYPYSFLCMRTHQWTFSFLLVCLGYIYMESKG
jgi:hypothetical protein